MDWKQLIQAVGPVAIGMATKGQHGAVLRGYMAEQDRIANEERQQQQEAQRRRQVGAAMSMELMGRLQQETDPVRFEQLRSTITKHADAYGIDPNEFASMPLPDGSADKLKELSQILDGLSRSGYNPDDLAESGASVKLKNGQTIPVSDALRLTQAQPVDASGAVVPRPKKADTSPLGIYARSLNKAPADLTWEEMQAFNKQEATSKKVDPAVDPSTRTLRELQIEGQRLRNQGLRNPKPAAGAADDEAFIQSILDNPTIYDSMTPSEKSKYNKALAAKGFGFGKPLAESAITKIAESKAAIQSLGDLRSILKENEQYIGPVAGLAALNPYSDARKAQADIDRVKQRVGKALEGGVLRKEDEEKYKKILATLNDTPETAIYKVDQLVLTLQKDLEAFEAAQRSAGRRVGAGESRQMPAEMKPQRTGKPSQAPMIIGGYEVTVVR